MQRAFSKKTYLSSPKVQISYLIHFFLKNEEKSMPYLKVYYMINDIIVKVNNNNYYF
jgi:hypothetical protein